MVCKERHLGASGGMHPHYISMVSGMDSGAIL